MHSMEAQKLAIVKKMRSKNKHHKSKSQKKQNSKRHHSTRRNKSRTQRGGVSPACILPTAGNKNVLVHNTGANIHNTNPQASLDLDNKFMGYGGPVPLGSCILQGGANKCGDEGVGTGNPKSETFKQYIEGLSNKYNLVGGAGAASNNNNEGYKKEFQNELNNTLPPVPSDEGVNYETEVGAQPTVAAAPTDYLINQSDETNQINLLDKYNSNSTIIMPPKKRNNKEPPSSMSGGGFTTDPSEYIAGLPVYKAYDDCCPPAIVNGTLKFGAPDQPVCGLGAIKGGARKGSKKSVKKSKKNSKNKKSRRTQRGGADMINSVRQSHPAAYSDAFNGPASVFAYPDDMKTRDFGAKQPNYGPNAI